MCEVCDSGEAQAGIAPALAARARRIEAALPGARVPDEAWRILLGEMGGAIAWVDTQRMLGCLEEASKVLCARLRCDAVGGGLITGNSAGVA
jgi:hypothetical protein